MNNCYPNRPNCRPSIPNCRLVLEKYHRLVKEADMLAKEQEELVDNHALKGIIYAIGALEKSACLLEEIEMITEKSERLLEESGCGNTCNSNNPNCQALEAEFVENFIMEVKYLDRALVNLEAALCDIKESIKYRNKGYRALEQYIKCVHGPKPCPPNPCHPNPCPPNPCPPCRHR